MGVLFACLAPTCSVIHRPVWASMHPPLLLLLLTLMILLLMTLLVADGEDA
jgi:hypothetical protein